MVQTNHCQDNIIHDKKAYNFHEKFMEKNLMPISYLQDGLIVIAHWRNCLPMSGIWFCYMRLRSCCYATAIDRYKHTHTSITLSSGSTFSHSHSNAHSYVINCNSCAFIETGYIFFPLRTISCSVCSALKLLQILVEHAPPADTLVYNNCKKKKKIAEKKVYNNTNEPIALM